ncbi:MAG: hypothetical protein IKL41_02630 [Clostridia bacterium]|nr:hypothetical protein [Clostridia bacterium]
MNKEIKTKLEKLSKEELVDIINMICEIPDVEKTLKLLVSPTKKDIDRELSSFERWCNSVANNPCSEKAENGLYTSAFLLWRALDSVDVNTAARIIFEMYNLTSDITEYSDVAVDINCYSCSLLYDLVKNHPNSFSKEEFDKYSYITDIYD